MTLQELKNQPKYVRVLADTLYYNQDSSPLIGQEYELHSENHSDHSLCVRNGLDRNFYFFNRSDVQFLTPIEFNGKKIGIGDSVLLNEGWHTVYDYFYRDGEWALVSVGNGGELQYDCYVTYPDDITDHRPLQIADPAKLKWQQEMERLKEEGRKNGWE